MKFDSLKEKIYQLVRASEKYTQTDMVYLSRGGFWLIFGQIISSLTAFAMSLVFANLLPKETYGQYRYLISIFSLLSIFSLQGINTAILRAVAQGNEGTFIKGFITRLKWSILGSVSAVALSFYFFYFNHNLQFTAALLIIAAFLPFMNSSELYLSYLSGKRLFNKKMRYSTATQILASSAVAITLLFSKNLLLLLFVYFFSYSLIKMLCFILVIKTLPPNQHSDPGAISFGKHLSIMEIIAAIVQEADKVLLFNILGPAQLAVYSFAVLPIDQIRAPLQVIQELALPKLSVRSTEEIKKSLPPKLLKMVFLILLGIIAYIFLIPFFFKAFYPQYSESVFYTRIFAFNLLVFPMSMICLALQARKKIKELYKINIVVQSTQIILLAILAPLFGILGVVGAKVIILVPYFFIAWFYFKRID